MASNEAVVLSEKDRDYIEEILRESANRLGNYPARPLSERQFSEGEDHQGPETYIAIPVEPEGIEGYTHAAENVADEDDIPGIGECNIFQLVDGKLSWVEKVQQVYNLTESRIRNDCFPVTRTKYGPWIVIHQRVEVEGILTKDLYPAAGPLTGATFGFVRLIEWAESREDESLPDKWQLTNRVLRFVNRSVSFKGTPGTYGRFGKEQGEFHPNVLDCSASEEGVNAIIDIFSDTYGGFTYGG